MTGRAEIATFWLVSTPVFLVGLAEDLTMRVSVRIRLLVTAAAAGLGMVALGAIVTRLNVPLIDCWMLSTSVVSIAFTLFAVTGIPQYSFQCCCRSATTSE